MTVPTIASYLMIFKPLNLKNSNIENRSKNQQSESGFN